MSNPCILVNRPGPQLDDLTVEDLSHNTASHPSLEHVSKRQHLTKAIPSESPLREPSSTHQPHTFLNPTTRALSGKCDTYLASPPGTPYNKRCRPALYIPALRRACTLDIPEDLSATLVDAVFRAEVRFKTVPSEVPTEPSVSPERGLSENHEWDSWDYDEATISDFFADDTLITSTPKSVRIYKLEHGVFPDEEVRFVIPSQEACAANTGLYGKEITELDLTWTQSLYKEHILSKDLGDATADYSAELSSVEYISVELLDHTLTALPAVLDPPMWRHRDSLDPSSDDEDCEDDTSPFLDEGAGLLDSGLASSDSNDYGVVHLVSLAQRWLLRDTPTTAPPPSLAVSPCVSSSALGNGFGMTCIAALVAPCAETPILPVLALTVPTYVPAEDVNTLGSTGNGGNSCAVLSPILLTGLTTLVPNKDACVSELSAEDTARPPTPPPVTLSPLALPGVSSSVSFALGLDLFPFPRSDSQDDLELALEVPETDALELDTDETDAAALRAWVRATLESTSCDLDTLELVSPPMGCSASSLLYAAGSLGSLRLLVTHDSPPTSDSPGALSASSSSDGISEAGSLDDDAEEAWACRWERVRTGAACVALAGSAVLLSLVGFGAA
ncbi:hypothetical protein C2E23DRAFT_829687 [Lenzites betulinus]|nr:hypothetical protein C2E23DRAFT_829687 [Lenzites betulinus]